MPYFLSVVDMASADRYFDDGEVSIRGNVYYDAHDDANSDMELEDISESGHISIHSSHDDYDVPVRSHSVMDGFEDLSGHSVRNYESPSCLGSPWHVRSEAASAPPDLTETRMISDSSRYEARKGIVSVGAYERQRHADTDYRRSAARSNEADMRDSRQRQRSDSAGARDINQAAAVRAATRQGIGEREASGLARRTNAVTGGEITRQTDRPTDVDVDRLHSAVRSNAGVVTVCGSLAETAAGRALMSNTRTDHPRYVADPHNVDSVSHPNTVSSQSNVVMMPVHYDNIAPHHTVYDMMLGQLLVLIQVFQLLSMSPVLYSEA